MWWFWGTIFAVVVAFAVVGMAIERRRGPSGPNEQRLDFNQNNRSGEQHGGGTPGPTSGGAA